MKIFLGLCLLSMPAAWGQFFEVWFSAGQSLLQNKGLGAATVIGGTKDDYQLTDGFRISFRMAFNGLGHTGHEVLYAYNRTQLRLTQLGTVSDTGMAIHQGGYNFLLYATSEGIRIRPFATGGIQFNNFVPPGASASRGQGSTKIGVNYGGGVKVRLTSLFALRFDVRQYISPKPFDLPLKSGWLRMNEVSAGFGAYF